MARGKILDERSITGQKGIALIERVCLKLGLAWHPRNASLDAGIDGLIEIRDPESARATNCVLQVQSKATKGQFTAETESAFEYLCDERDITYWLGGNAPVILIVSRPDADEAYWKSIPHCFQSPAERAGRRVFFNKSDDRFDESARSRLVELAVPRNSGLHFPPPPKAEQLFSNLLPVVYAGPDLFIAETEFRTSKALWATANENGWRLNGEWLLHEGKILSFWNLREEPWPQVCHFGTVERFSVQEWSESEDPIRRRQFAQLLHRALQEKLHSMGVRYSRKEHIFWFLPPLAPNTTDRKFSYKSIEKNVSRTVVKAYLRADASIKHYRHNALKAEFERYNGVWHLQLTPTYRFTVDGRQLSRFSDSYLKGIKQLEKNHAVFGQVLMWSRFLTQQPDMYSREYPFLSFGPLLTVDVDAAIEDSDWLSKESLADRSRLLKDLAVEGLWQ